MRKLFVLIIGLLISVPSILAQNFTDDLSNQIGEFPSNWNLISGTAKVDLIEGSKSIVMGGETIVSLKSNVPDYLKDEFKIEFDLYFDKVVKSVGNQNYKLRLWAGKSAGKLPTGQGMESYRAITVKRHGATTSITGGGPKKEFDNYLSDLRDHNPVWRHIEVSYNDQTLKLLIDNKLILNIPNYDLDPSQFSVEADSWQGLQKAIKDVRVQGFINTATSETTASTSTSTSAEPTETIQDTNSEAGEGETGPEENPSPQPQPKPNPEQPQEEELPPPEENPVEEPSPTPQQEDNVPTQDDTPTEAPVGEIIELEPTEGPTDQPTDEPEPEEEVPIDQPPIEESEPPSDGNPAILDTPCSKWEVLRNFIVQNYKAIPVTVQEDTEYIFCDDPRFYDLTFRENNLTNDKIIFKNDCFLGFLENCNELYRGVTSSILVVPQFLETHITIALTANFPNSDFYANINLNDEAFSDYFWNSMVMSPIGYGPKNPDTNEYLWWNTLDGNALASNSDRIQIKVYNKDDTSKPMYMSILFGETSATTLGETTIWEAFFIVPDTVKENMQRILPIYMLVAD